jgi:hypothetical protein
MNKISKENVLLVLGIALVLCSTPAMGREGHGDSFMRAFGMKVKSDGFVHSYQNWSHKLAGLTGETDSVGPVLAQGDGGGYGDGFENIQFPEGWLTNLFSFGGSISAAQVSFAFLPYGYAYRGYR